jgi:sigma-B regulation protein RsbU (phosphoserine phosphatase)
MDQNQIDQIIKGITTFSEEDDFEGNLRNIVLLYQEKEAEVVKLRREHRNFEMLFEASKIINSSIELDDVLDRVMDMALDITQAERGFLIMFDKVGELHMKVTRNMNQDILTTEENRASTTIVNRVLEEGKSVYTNDAQLDKRFNTAASIMELNLRTIICSPLRIKDNIIGAIYVDNRMIEDDFMQQSLPLIETLADNAAIAIENAKLYKEKKKKQQIEQELHFANKIQNHLLPHEIPELNGLDVYGVMIPAREVGGDYYDFIVRNENDAIFSIGDVSGKGFSAGILMAGARMIIRSLAETLDSPKEILSRANKVLDRDLKSYRFMTMLLMHWNGKELSWTSAGHEHIIFFDSETEKCSMLKSKGLALGLQENINASLAIKKLELKSGDALVLYTDGITDAMNREGERFGKDRLIQIVEQNGHLHPKDISKEILLNAHKFIGDNELFDDITLVTIKKE